MAKVNIEFYQIELTRAYIGHTDEDSTNEFTKKEFLEVLKNALNSNLNTDLVSRKKNIISSKKYYWLSYCNIMKNNDMDFVFKSAQKDHVRNVINTETMKYNKNAKKGRNDGDEEKTHICIRNNENNENSRELLCIFENYFYGVTIKQISKYFNDIIKEFTDSTSSNYEYYMNFYEMPGEDFIDELNSMKTVNFLSLEVEQGALADDFINLANNLDGYRDTIDILLKRKGFKKNDSISKNSVQAFFKEYNNKNIIKRIRVDGKGKNGSIHIDTEIIKLKRKIDVEASADTSEVDDKSFFDVVNKVLDKMKEE